MQQLFFWLSALQLGYTYIGYPFLLWVWARRIKTSVPVERIQPAVSILVIVHNEAALIGIKIENILALDYPASLREIVIASDASTDATVRIAMSYSDAGVRVVEFTQHRGKPAVLNQLIPRMSGDIIVLMDVRQLIDANALQIMLNKFSDSTVGAVSGELILSGSVDGVDGVGFYWRYEKFIRLKESLIDSSIGVTGAFYAIRKQLFEAIPEQTILDDVLIPMQVVRRGYRVLFETKALVRDKLSATAKLEFMRKVRTIAGNFQLIHNHLWLLKPGANRLWFQYFSHKVCRLICPVTLALLLVMNLLLLDHALYRITLALQLLFYSAAVAGQMLSNTKIKHPLVTVPHAFCLLNWCTLVGFYRYLRGQQKVTWKKTESDSDTSRSSL